MFRIGMIGAGHFAKAHLKALEEFSADFAVTAYTRNNLADPFPEADALGAKPMPLDQVLASQDVDVVAVCTTNDLHRSVAEAALRAGKHVFCEKPLAMTVQDADAVVEAAEASPGTLVVGHLARMLPVYEKMHRVLASGRLGAPRAAYFNRMHCGGGRSWRMDPKLGGGVIFDLLIHDLDLMTWCLGKPCSVVARGHKHVQGAHDYASAIFTFPEGVVAVVEGGFMFRPPAGLRSMTRVVCERGHIEVNTADSEAPIRIFEEGVEEERVSVQLDNLLTQGLVAEYGELLAAIQGEGERHLRYEDARVAVACAASIIDAADRGTEIAIA